MNDDAELLRRYVEEGANEAFASLVTRHVDFVYSAALRQLRGDAHLAADATQIVFTDLARKATTLMRHRVLAGWLFTSTRYATAKLVRGEQRRRAREREAELMEENHRGDSSAALDWQRVRPVLDEALGELSERDREAILLRFFEGRDYASVGARLNLSDNTARMRVDRALDKLRGLLERRGVTSSSGALAVALTSQAVAAAPVGLATTVAGAALGAATIGGATTAAAGGGLAAVVHFMSIAKLQLGLGGVALVASATGYVLQADTTAKLRGEVARLRQETATVSAVKAENLQLARLAAEAADLRRDDREFVRLQQEAAELKTRLAAIARAEEKARRESSGTVYDISKLDRTPVPSFQRRPEYPAEMREAGAAGEVIVDFVVDANGEVAKAFALRSSRREFEAAAVAAVSAWKFKPGVKGGREVATHMQVPIVFTLDKAKSVSTLAGPRPQDDFVVKLQTVPVEPGVAPTPAPKRE